MITERSLLLSIGEHFERHWSRVCTDRDVLSDELIVTLRIGYEELMGGISKAPIAERIRCCHVRFVTRAIELRAKRKGLRIYGRKRR